MDANGWGTLGSQWRELNELDRVLDLLARPARLGSGVPRSVRSELRGLGLDLGRSAERKELIEWLWSRKRPLLRELGASDNPLPPCA
ncbi:MAG: hypothetical protein E6I39_01595 [Chloroflexi bacterium]|nr:MAG: hypothetical protein E6I98_13565 [Chloroflexota bacterium]TMF02152.1 MAG: hypothetical protein E6I39_01595 [Chloroflexota bacterium]